MIYYSLKEIGNTITVQYHVILKCSVYLFFFKRVIDSIKSLIKFYEAANDNLRIFKGKLLRTITSITLCCQVKVRHRNQNMILFIF